MTAAPLAALASLCARRPGPVGIFLLLISLGAAFGLTRFEVDPDVSALLPENHPDVELFLASHLEEESSKSLFLLVRGADLEVDLPVLIANYESSSRVARVAATREDFAPHSTDDSSQGARQAPLWHLPSELLDDLQEHLSSAGLEQAAAQSKELLSSDPLMGASVVKGDPVGLRAILSQANASALPPAFDPNSEYLLTEQGRAAFLRIEGTQPAFDVDFSEALLADLEARSANFDVTMAGGYTIAREDSRRIRGDLASSFNWSIPLLFLFLLLSTRSFRLPHFYLIPTATAVFWTLGYGALLLGPMSPLAVCSAAILCGLGIDFSIHYLGRFEEEHSSQGYETALRRTHVTTGKSLIGCWLSSCAAFLSFSLGSFSGLRDLGYLLAIGLSFALLATWTLLPLLLRRFPQRERARPMGFVVGRFRSLARSRYAGLAALTLIGLAAAGWAVSSLRGVHFDADPRHMRPADSEVGLALHEIETSLGFSAEGITLLLDDEHSPQLLVEAAEQLEARGIVAFSDAGSLVSKSPERRERVAEFRAKTSHWVENASTALAQQGLRVESLLPSLRDVADQFSGDPDLDTDQGARLDWKGQRYWRAQFHPQRALRTGEERRAFREALQAAVAAPTRAMDPAALGDSIGPLLARELRESVGGCALIVALVILASVGRWRQGWIAMLPVACGLGAVLGFLSLSGWPIHPGNLLALPLLVGLGVDDGLYMVNRHLEGAADPVSTTGIDVWRTSVATSIGFGSLVMAESPAIASLGAIVLVGTATCFLTTIVLVPWLLRRSSHA